MSDSIIKIKESYNTFIQEKDCSNLNWNILLSAYCSYVSGLAKGIDSFNDVYINLVNRCELYGCSDSFIKLTSEQSSIEDLVGRFVECLNKANSLTRDIKRFVSECYYS